MQKHLVGFCEFEADRKRAAAATLLAQDFRLWQNINNLKVTFGDGSERFLSDEERLTLGNKLTTSKKMSWDQVRKILDSPERSTFFNLERTYKSGLMGNQSAALLSNAVGKKIWKALGEREQEALITDLLTITDDDGLLKRLRRHWHLDEAVVSKLLKVRLPKGYMHLSSMEMRNIVPHLKRAATEDDQGLNYAEACKAAGYNHTNPQALRNDNAIPYPGTVARVKKRKGAVIEPNHADELLQPHVEIGELRNPMVERALYQVRRVVNAIIQRYGKPDIIRVEMARDLKANSRQREEMEKRNRSNEKFNNSARERLVEYGIAHPSRSDLIKYRLWEECEQVCPYTGQSINMDGLFGDNPQFDIEHIIPYSRCLDDSYMNKTLCARKENADKGNLTPAEYYSKNEVRYKEVLARAKNLPYPKFKRFALDAIKDLDEFVSQQLNETRYIARQAIAFLSQLGVKVEPVKGGTTALLRHAWGIGGLLNDSGVKTRLDHRHHAVDALTVALTTRSAVRALNTGYLREGRLRVEEQRQPMPKLREQSIEVLDRVVVSHKAQRKLKGSLHEETLYGFSDKRDEKGNKLVTIRKPLSMLKPKDLELIKDETLREYAKAHLANHGDMKSAFGQIPTTFTIPSKSGSRVPVNKVRLSYPLNVEAVGKGPRKRHVKTGSNHHMAIYRSTNTKGEEKWLGRVVTTLQGAQRKVNGEPLIDIEGAEGEQFHIALHINDMVELEHKGERIICYLQMMMQRGEVIFRPHTDATVKADRTFQISKRPETMRKSGLRLLQVDAIGKL
ncbi:type II CRISPR RNA-guided endonuclease Cas9 [Solemya pervernicosa gill symbiont]|uniref:Type II CRISPR RNA-guided endonuclease Cas9 n=1 Tax=Solemya pervernicosa gill symbiont TaxID=642797 RepID=A0A1T2L213_9GAMM|nr:type II CRISPR RNA-guided endonuclease Cas9 [Solemya pervernicosa gill symbiont]